MKEYLTFENILGVIMVAASLINLSTTTKRMAQLGELKKKTLNGPLYTDLSQLLWILLALVAWIFAYRANPKDNTTVVFFLSFIIAIVAFLISALYMVFKPAGFYENGISTGASFMMYSEITVYKIVENKNGSNVRFVFNPRGKIFANAIRLFVSNAEIAETKEFIKKNCKFKRQK